MFVHGHYPFREAANSFPRVKLEENCELRGISQGNKYQWMATSHLRDGTEPAVFVPEVAKQHGVTSLRYAVVAVFGVLVSSRASF